MKKFELRQIGEYEFVGSIEDSRPDVHEIAMRLAVAAVDNGNVMQADPSYLYEVAQEFYNAGAAWERNSKEG